MSGTGRKKRPIHDTTHACLHCNGCAIDPEICGIKHAQAWRAKVTAPKSLPHMAHSVFPSLRCRLKGKTAIPPTTRMLTDTTHATYTMWTRHYNRVHSGYNPRYDPSTDVTVWPCVYTSCRVVCATKAQHRKHMLLCHLDRPLYQCPACALAVHDADALYAHIYRVHPTTNHQHQSTDRAECVLAHFAKQGAFTNPCKSPSSLPLDSFVKDPGRPIHPLALVDS